jgi:hypothetical protein
MRQIRAGTANPPFLPPPHDDDMNRDFTISKSLCHGKISTSGNLDSAMFHMFHQLHTLSYEETRVASSIRQKFCSTLPIAMCWDTLEPSAATGWAIQDNRRAHTLAGNNRLAFQTTPTLHPDVSSASVT